jgi:hypothetical protein
LCIMRAFSSCTSGATQRKGESILERFCYYICSCVKTNTPRSEHTCLAHSVLIILEMVLDFLPQDPKKRISACLKSTKTRLWLTVAARFWTPEDMAASSSSQLGGMPGIPSTTWIYKRAVFFFFFPFPFFFGCSIVNKINSRSVDYRREDCMLAREIYAYSQPDRAPIAK